jgi:chromosome partitioning protein
VRTVAGLGWPTEESAESSDLGWPTTYPQNDLSIKSPVVVSHETTVGEGAGRPPEREADVKDLASEHEAADAADSKAGASVGNGSDSSEVDSEPGLGATDTGMPPHAEEGGAADVADRVVRVPGPGPQAYVETGADRAVPRGTASGEREGAPPTGDEAGSAGGGEGSGPSSEAPPTGPETGTAPPPSQEEVAEAPDAGVAALGAAPQAHVEAGAAGVSRETAPGEVHNGSSTDAEPGSSGGGEGPAVGPEQQSTVTETGSGPQPQADTTVRVPDGGVEVPGTAPQAYVEIGAAVPVSPGTAPGNAEGATATGSEAALNGDPATPAEGAFPLASGGETGPALHPEHATAADSMDRTAQTPAATLQAGEVGETAEPASGDAGSGPGEDAVAPAPEAGAPSADPGFPAPDPDSPLGATETGAAPQTQEQSAANLADRTIEVPGTAPQAYVETGAEPPVSRETPSPHDRQETMPPTEGLPDTATQGVEQARFGPTLSPTAAPITAAELAAESTSTYADPSTPIAMATHQGLRAEKRPAPELPRPDHPRVMVIANQKGGVGKTTTTVNMAAALAQHGLRVLIIDLDPQGNASTALGIDHSAGTPGVYEVMADGTPMKDVIRPCPDVPGLYGVPATIDLAGAEIELVSLVARESRLRKALDAYLQSTKDGEERFDYVFIDCPPSLGLLTINALVAGREMLIPIQCEYYALEGVSQLLRNVDMVRAHLNPDLRVSTIVLTMYDGRTRLAAGVADEVRQHFGDVVLRTAIPRSVRISEAPSYGQTVITYDPTSSGALSYLEAARELASHHPQQTEEP